MRKLELIFDSKIRPGDAVLHRVSEDTLQYVSEYEPGLTSVVKHRGISSVPFLVANENIIKFRGYMFFEWVGQKASVLNKRLARVVSGRKGDLPCVK